MLRSRRALTATALGALTLAVASCGDDEGSGGGGAGTGAGAASTPATETVSPTSTGAASDGDRPGAEASDGPKRGELKVMASGLEVPWDVAFLPDGDAIVSERDRGRLVRIPAGGGEPDPVMDVPGVRASGEGGLLGLAVSPRFAEDDTLFAYLTAESDNRVVAIDLETQEVTPILTGLGKAEIHNGGALEFGPDRKLYVGVGENGTPGLAQDRGSLNGKILRIDPDGDVPSSNPIEGSAIWSLGHRNVQGLGWDRSGRLWASEFGQNEVDEVNVIRKGGNYGWPLVEGDAGTQGGRFVAPAVTWSPTSTSSPSGAAVVGDELYVGALAGRTLWQVPLSGADAGPPKGLFPNRYGRVRGVVPAPDGSVWFTTSNRDGRGDPADEDDRVIRLGT